MSNYSQAAWKAQQDRNDQLIADSKYMRPSVTSQVLPLQIDVAVSDDDTTYRYAGSILSEFPRSFAAPISPSSTGTWRRSTA